MGAGDVRRTAEHWADALCRDREEGGGLSWHHLAPVQRRLNAKISGDEAVGWAEHVVRTHLAGRAPVPECLSLCCGRGQRERELASAGAFAHCTAYDVSLGALEAARAEAERQGYPVDYRAADMNAIELPEGAYDLILAHAALHHLHALEHVVEQISLALKPDGLMVVQDYVGPSGFELPPRALELGDAALRLLPERYRRSVSFARHGRVGPGAQRRPIDTLRLVWRKLHNGTLVDAAHRRMGLRRLRAEGQALVKTQIPRFTRSELAVDDPSEAVRSADIMPLLESTFDVIERRPLGGGLLWLLLDDIAANFGEDDETAAALLAMLFDIEDALMAAGELESYYVFLVARRRGPDA